MRSSLLSDRHTPLFFLTGKNAPVTEAECEGPCCGMRRFLTTNGEAPGVGPTGLQREEEEEGWWWLQGKWKGFTTGQLQLLESEEGGGCQGEKACKQKSDKLKDEKKKHTDADALLMFY